jgi:hypothetical protein
MWSSKDNAIMLYKLQTPLKGDLVKCYEEDCDNYISLSHSQIVDIKCKYNGKIIVYCELHK